MESLERKLALREQAGIYGGLAGRIAGLSRAGQIVRSTVPVDGDDVPIIDSIEKVDDVVGRVNDAVEEVDSALENAYEAAQEALEAKQKAVEALADAIAAMEGIEDLEAELTPKIEGAQVAADAAAVEAADAKAKALQNIQDILTLSNEQAVLAAEARDAWNKAVEAGDAAEIARLAAVSAGEAATQAQTTANGKTKLVRSTAAASGQGTTVGDVWWRFSNAQFTGPVIGQWTWSGSAWVPSTIGSEIIEALTVDKLTVTGGAKIPTAVIDTLVGDQAFFNAVLANRIVVAGNNLVWDSTYRGWDSPAFGNPVGGPGTGFVTDVVRPGMSVSQKLTQYAGAQSTQSLYSATRAQVNISNNVNTDRLIYVGDRVGEKLVAYAHWYVDKSVANSNGTGISTQVYFYNKDGQNFSNQNGGRIPFTQVPVGEWFKVGGTQLTVPEGALYAQVRPAVYFTNNTAPSNTAAFYLGGEEAYWGVGAVLIEDGAITAPKITASQELSAKVAEFIEVKASQLVADNAAMNAAFIKQLVGEQAFFDSMLTGRLIVAGSNLIPWSAPNLIPFTNTASNGAVIGGGSDAGRGGFAYSRGGTGTDGSLGMGICLTGGQTATRTDSISVAEGDTYSVRVEVGLYDLGGNVPGGASVRSARVRTAQYDAAGAYISGTVIYGNTLTNLGYGRGQWSEAQVKIVPGAKSLAVWVEKAWWSSGSLAVMTAEVMKSVGAVLIEDGAVTAPKLHVDALNFKTAIGLDLTSGTVTGATIRTAASGQRLQMDVEGLKAYGPSGNVTANLSSSGAGMGLLGDIYFETSSGGKTNLLSFNGDDIHLGHTTSGLVNTLVVTPSSDQFQIETHRRVGGGEAPIIALHSRVTNPGNTFALKSQLDAWAAPAGTHAWVTSEGLEYVRAGGAWCALADVARDTAWISLGVTDWTHRVAPQVRVRAGRVQFRGLISNNSFTGGFTSCGSLPTGIPGPPHHYRTAKVEMNSTVSAVFRVHTNGSMQMWREGTSDAWLDLSRLSYETD